MLLLLLLPSLQPAPCLLLLKRLAFAALSSLSRLFPSRINTPQPSALRPPTPSLDTLPPHANMSSDPDYAWKPNNRPQSTVARNFMTELNSLFNLDDDLDTLDKTVNEKKQAVSTQTQELEALQARLREAEERLNQARTSSPPRPKDTTQHQQQYTPSAASAAPPAAAPQSATGIPFATRLPQAATALPGATTPGPSSQ
jgi:uncharacterized coiled-coil protein SlyX